MTTDEGFDVIGDVHGMCDKLIVLLIQMGYDLVDGAWRHPSRRAVFVGDLIDRGPQQNEAVALVRSMVVAGTALIVAGNHEFNAVAFHTRDPSGSDAYLRKHTPKNVAQHQEFLDQVGAFSSLHRETIEWFETLPLWLELDGLRVVHACWDPSAIERLRPLVSGTGGLTPALIERASQSDAQEFADVEHVLKGPEVVVSPSYLDKERNPRNRARYRWWLPDATTLDVGALIPGHATQSDGSEYPSLPATRIDPPVSPYTSEVPVIYGHYWETGERRVSGPVTACVDYSAVKGGPLVAYRWSGERTLVDENFVATTVV